MAPTVALVSALLIFQAAAGVDKAAVFTQTLACQNNAGGCTCAAIGLVENTAKAMTNCTGTAATMNNCMGKCCLSPTAPTCHSAHMADNKMCGSGKQLDYTKVTGIAGATTAAKVTNCCKSSAATCATVTCSNRRRRQAGVLKAKAGQGAVACTSNDDCESKCCETDATSCGANQDYQWRAKKCGSDHRPKTWCNDAEASAIMATKFTNATYKSVCCDARATCSATPTCAINYEPMKPMRQTKCSRKTCAMTECCQLKAQVTMCSSYCTVQGGAFTSDGCSSAVNTCESSKCAATGGRRLGSHTMASVIDVSKTVANGATATNATIKSSCCISKTKPAPSVNAKCSAYFAAAAAGAQAAAKASGAHLQQASLPILAVAALLSMKIRM